jgi:Ser-tRNA(Ala) deacylase AlaX
MTQQIFCQDSYLQTIETIIDAVDLINGCTALAFEENIFHPKGGGQPSDYGEVIIAEVHYPVRTLQKKKDRIFVVLDCEIPDADNLWGEEIKCSINWERRHQLMRYHTGGHVLMSSARQVVSGYNPKGMDIQESLDYGEITFFADQEIVEDQAVQILNIAKQAINSNLGVEAKSYGNLELAKNENELCFRVDSDLKLKGKVRVIVIDGFDANPCGGTHVKSLTEVGNIEIKSISYNEIKKEANIKFVLS